ncbi:hypothetical protein LXL04_022625 [Taraxacum kok-saghyz]
MDKWNTSELMNSTPTGCPATEFRRAPVSGDQYSSNSAAPVYPVVASGLRWRLAVGISKIGVLQYKIDSRVGNGAYWLADMEGTLLPRSWNAIHLKAYFI